MRIGTISLALLVVVAVTAGCGGSSSSSTSSKAASSGSAATVANASASTTAATSTSSAAPTFASGSNCQALADLGAKYVSEIAATSSSGPPNMTAALQADQAMADASPSAIHSQAEYVVHAFGSFENAIASSGYKLGTTPTAAQLATLAGVEQQFKRPTFVSDLHQIDSWIHQNCRGVTP